MNDDLFIVPSCPVAPSSLRDLYWWRTNLTERVRTKWEATTRKRATDILYKARQTVQKGGSYLGLMTTCLGRCTPSGTLKSSKSNPSLQRRTKAQNIKRMPNEIEVFEHTTRRKYPKEVYSSINGVSASTARFQMKALQEQVDALTAEMKRMAHIVSQCGRNAFDLHPDDSHKPPPQAPPCPLEQISAF
ncbi:hypothetical protein AKJ16_DCAP16911 [Drosera capensis]